MDTNLLLYLNATIRSKDRLIFRVKKGSIGMISVYLVSYLGYSGVLLSSVLCYVCG